MAYVLDGILVVLFLLLVWIGHRRGFIKTVSGVVAFAAALVLSSLLAGPVSGFVYDTFVEPPVQEALVAQIGDGSPAADKLDNALADMPALITNQLEANGLNSGAAILERINTANGEETVDQRILTQVVEPMAVPLLKAVCTLLLFLILLIVLTILFKTVDLVAKLPLLKQMNKLLGVVAGAAQGILWVCFAVAALQLVANMGWIDAITPAVLEETFVVDWIASFNPLSAALRELVVF